MNNAEAHSLKQTHIVRLSGGIGNQMFQYAFGERLRHDTGAQVIYFPRVAHMNFRLHQFTGVENLYLGWWHPEILFRYVLPKVSNNYFGRIKKVLPRPMDILSDDGSYAFEQEMLRPSRSSLYSGYWQNYNYVQPIEKHLRKQFIFSNKVIDKYKKFDSYFATTNTVSLHVRRGDYVRSKDIDSCNQAYYRRAMSMMADAIDRPTFVVFSDEPAWAKRAFEERSDVIIANDTFQPASDMDDLYVMSRCKHHIIANSTFSWWGAWLNQNPGKLVIAPTPWWETAHQTAEKILPPEWLKIDKMPQN